MRVAELRAQAADQRLVREQRIEVHRHCGQRDPLIVRRDSRVEVGQRLAVIEPAGLGHDASDEIEHPPRLALEVGQVVSSVGDRVGASFVQPAPRPCAVVGRRQPLQGQVIGARQVRLGDVAIAFEHVATFLVDQRGQPIGEPVRCRIVRRRLALRLDIDRPAGAEPLQRAVEPRRGCDQLRLGRAIEVGTPEAGGALEAAVLVEDDSRRDDRGPRQVIGEASRSGDGARRGTTWINFRSGAAARWRRATGRIWASRRAAMTASPWPATAITSPAIQRRKPMPTAAASVPLTIASARGAPASRIGSASARCTGATKPGNASVIRPALRRRS